MQDTISIVFWWILWAANISDKTLCSLLLTDYLVADQVKEDLL